MTTERTQDPRWLLRNLRRLCKDLGARRQYGTYFWSPDGRYVSVLDSALTRFAKNGRFLANTIAEVVTTIGVQTTCLNPLCNEMLFHVEPRGEFYTRFGEKHDPRCGHETDHGNPVTLDVEVTYGEKSR